MAGCRLASKGRTMADSSYASEVQAILAFLSLQRTGSGGPGSQPQGPDASTEGLNPYGLVAPRFQRKFKAKQVPEGVGGGTGHRADLIPSAPAHLQSLLPLDSPVFAHSFSPVSLRQGAGPLPEEVSWGGGGSGQLPTPTPTSGPGSAQRR